jgi:hypothetical protein
MRHKLTALLLVLPCLPTMPSVAASESAVMQSTPSGTGDPDATLCRAPQRITGSDQFGPQVCLHNDEWWKMAMDGKDLAPDGKNLIDRPTVKDPKGEGDPDAITCRTRKVVSHWTDRVTQYGPVVCRLNSFWADLIKGHQRVDANGKVVPRWFNADYSGLNGFYSGNGAGSGMPDSGNVPSGGPAPH